KLGGEVFNGVKHGWRNAIAQLKVANPEVKFNLQGTGMLREVVDGQIIVPEKYKDMELDELEADPMDSEAEDEDEQEEENQEGREEGHGESDG
ncbi:hypothetical protein A2U01_0072740, partial [Trifolium medium]|nr:hypothetical protein [Trifolium medium]